MSQGYKSISVTEKVSESLAKLLERDETGVTLSAGTTPPQDVTPEMIGRLFLKTDSKELKYISKYENGSYTWSTIINFSNPLATVASVQANYQPLHKNLTALSKVTSGANKIPYFNSATTMATLDVNAFFRSLVNASASSLRTSLGLGNLATLDTITGNQISNGSIPLTKLNFTPITQGEGYTVGDIKESYSGRTVNEAKADGFLILDSSKKIGDASSGANYAGNEYWNLYSKIWGLDNVKYYDQGSSTASGKGSSATDDWNAHRRISLPSGTNYLNSNCHFEIRYL